MLTADSLVVCQTEIRDLSRMCIVLKGQDGVIEQARRQLEDLVSDCRTVVAFQIWPASGAPAMPRYGEAGSRRAGRDHLNCVLLVCRRRVQDT